MAAPVEALAVTRPSGGLSYPEVLRGRPVVVGLLGVVIGIGTFLVGSSVVVQSMVLLGWKLGVISGPDYATVYRAAARFDSPWGMLAVHLGLATLIPLSLALVRFVHFRPAVWLTSVRPGMRWRFLWLSAAVALVVLNLFLWLSHPGPLPALDPQPNFWWFLLVIVLTAPLQAAGEEFFFRGYLLQAFGSMVKSPWFGIVASALVFAGFHGVQNLPLFLDRFGFGLLAAVLVTRTGGLEAAIGAHVVNNLLAFTYAGLVSTIAEVKAIQQVGWVDLAWDLAGFGAFTLAALWLGSRLGVQTRTSAADQRASV